MNVRMFGLWVLMVAALGVVLLGCAGSPGKIRKVDSPTEKQLRVDWKNYHTFCLRSGYGVSTAGSAILFQPKGDKTIQKGGDWKEVTDEKTAADCANFFTRTSPVMSLLGENDEKFGYLIYEWRDSASVAVIGSKTIGLIYNAAAKTGGP
jgi:hypothetical protein